MKSKNSHKHLKQALERLDQSAQKIVATRGYTKEVGKLKALTELIKEQFKNENSDYSTSSLR